MFQRKTIDILIGMLNVFHIVGDILITGCDEHGKDHNKMLENVLYICRQASMKLNKEKGPSKCTNISFLSDVI